MFCYFTYNPKYSNKNLKIKMKKSSIFCLGGQDPFWSEDWTVLHIDPACQKIFFTTRNARFESGTTGSLVAYHLSYHIFKYVLAQLVFQKCHLSADYNMFFNSVSLTWVSGTAVVRKAGDANQV